MRESHLIFCKAMRHIQDNGFLICFVGVVIFQSLLLWYQAGLLSPSIDEPGHFVAGIDYWRNGKTHLYNVNPPFVKMVSSLPFVADQHVRVPRFGNPNWDEIRMRSEFDLGTRLIEDLSHAYMPRLVQARRVCLFFVILGTIGIYSLISRVSSQYAALWGATIWGFQPIVLSHGAILGMDIPGAGMGIWFFVCGWMALEEPTNRNLILTGIFLGLAITTKFTWLVLVPFWSCAILFLSTDGLLLKLHENIWRRFLIWAYRSLLVLGVAWGIICLSYRFNEMFVPLGKYSFKSKVMTKGSENRFRGGWLESVPCPVPADMLRGLDVQWRDFDEPLWCYLDGNWKKGGWYNFYCKALLYKLPLGTLFLLLLACYCKGLNLRFLSWILLPSFLIFILVSSKTSMNEHTRYVFILLPILAIVASLPFGSVSRFTRMTALTCGVFSILTGLVNYPCGMSFTNELVGGSRSAWKVLAGSNLDWETDWQQTKRWIQEHPIDLPIALVMGRVDGPNCLGFQVSMNQPWDVTATVGEIGAIEVFLIIPMNSRLELQRDFGFPTLEQTERCIHIGCSTEGYRLPLSQIRSLPYIAWLDPEHPFRW